MNSLQFYFCQHYNLNHEVYIDDLNINFINSSVDNMWDAISDSLDTREAIACKIIKWTMFWENGF